MNWELAESFLSQGQAILPVNQPGQGDVTLLVDKQGGEEYHPLPAATFLKHLLGYFGTDLVSLRRRYGEVIGKKKLVPVPLSNQWVLAPFSTRQPIGRQNRTGWIVACQIRGIEAQTPLRSTLLLHGYQVTVYHSKSFCEQQVRNARLVQLEYHRLHHQLPIVSDEQAPYR